MKLFYLTFSLVFISTLGLAQAYNFPCHSDEINSALYHDYPEMQEAIQNSRQELKVFTQEYISQNHVSRSNDPYIIPVVFHIIYDTDQANISEEQILDGLNMVNTQFRMLNADTNIIIPEFKHLAADVEVEFRLAKLDPDGNCTNGINRIFSPLSSTGGHVVKDLIQWPPDKYLNIWVCNFAGPSLAGHCLMPDAAASFPEWDGIVIDHTYVGSIGTSSDFTRTVLTHEIGHYLNLYHIWGGNNVPDFFYLEVGNSVNCDHDDEVEDTPNTIGWSYNGCNTNVSSCGSLDNVQNYMDYSYCHLMFTEGQKLRMHAALNSPVANRNNLWTEENLIATGIKDYTPVLCKANFAISNRVICAGESITFTDVSYHLVTSRTWTLQGASTTSSVDSSLTVFYNIPGKYDVLLEVTDGNTTETLNLIDYILVLENESTKAHILESFESEELVDENWILFSDDENSPQLFDSGFNSSTSILMNPSDYPKFKYNLTSQPIDASNIAKLYISFDFAYAHTSTSSSERIIIQLSKDCGATWQTKKTILLQGSSIPVMDTVFYPTSSEDWQHIEKDINLVSFSVPNLQVRFVFEKNKGNKLYLDNINIHDIEKLNIDNQVYQKKLNVYPNPTSSILNIEFEDGMLNGVIELVDISGKTVLTQTINHTSSVTLDVHSIASGTYFLKYSSNNANESFGVRRVIIE